MTSPMDELVRMCAEVAPPRAAALADGRGRLLAEARGVAGPAVLRPARRRRTVVGAAVATGLAGAVAAGALVAVTGSPGGSPRTPAGTPIRLTEVAQVTRLAADAAAGQPDLNPRDDQYVHSSSAELVSQIYTGNKDGSMTVSQAPRTNREIWLSVDGHKAGLLRETPCGKPGGKCEMRLDSPHGVPFQYTAAYFRTLPTDPAQLRAALEKLSGNHRAYDLWQTVQGLILEQYVPPRVMSAIVRVLGETPGVTVDRKAVDAVGRPGVALTLTDAFGNRNEIVFDRGNFHFLGYMVYAGPKNARYTPPPGEADLKPPGMKYTAREGSLVEAFALLHQEIVDRLPAGS